MPGIRRTFILINLLGGAAIVASYVWGLAYRPDAAAVLWSGVPEQYRRWITLNMLLAATGYLVFTTYLFRLIGSRQLAGHTKVAVVNALYAVILAFSALWMPLTWLAINQVSRTISWLVRLDLAIVGLAAIILLFVIIKSRSISKPWNSLAVLGAVFFNIQTIILDAVLWSVYFRV